MTAVVFDKTGTLTLGKPSVTDVEVVDDSIDESTLLRLVAAAEQNSEHVLAKAVVTHATNVLGTTNLPPATDFSTGAGMGIACTVQGRRIAVGNRAWMNTQGVALGHGDDKNGSTTATARNANAASAAAAAASAAAPDRSHMMDQLELEGKTVAAVAIDGRLAAFVALADKAKPEAAQVVAVLKRRGIRVYMLTGDNERTARMVANALGIRHVFAQVLPSHKADKVRELQAAGRVVAMVGDGINDAPALAQAELGVAVGTGTDVAVEAADVVLIKDHLMDVAVAIHLSHATVRRIHANFVWAIVYNAVGIPLAAGVLFSVGIVLKPVMASLAMAFSSVSVVVSSLWLKRYKKPSFTLAADLDARPPWSTRLMNALGRAFAGGRSALLVHASNAARHGGRSAGGWSERDVSYQPLITASPDEEAV